MMYQSKQSLNITTCKYQIPISELVQFSRMELKKTKARLKTNVIKIINLKKGENLDLSCRQECH